MDIGILTGGGDAAGLNPAIKWFVAALDIMDDGHNVIGIKDGWRGLEVGDPKLLTRNFERFRDNDKVHFLTLTSSLVRPWDRDGGTHLGSSRTNPCQDLKNSDGTVTRPASLRIEDVLKRFRALGLDTLVAIGGEDTLGVAARLSKDHGIRVVGIPKTIDLDIPKEATDYSLGFETALAGNTECINKLRTTAGSHSRILVVETMGRKAGHLALQTGIVNGAEVIVIPEHPFDITRIASILKEYRRARKHRYGIVVVAEGSRDKKGLYALASKEVDQFGHPKLGGVGQFIANGLDAILGKDSTRYMQLGHLQRGGPPVVYDRLMGQKFGFAAAHLVL